MVCFNSYLRHIVATLEKPPSSGYLFVVPSNKQQLNSLKSTGETWTLVTPK